VQVAKWGNSLAVRRPREVVEELGLRAGDQLDTVAVAPRRIEVAKDDRREQAQPRPCPTRTETGDGPSTERPPC
jgi:antitoxin MazE